MPSRVVAHRYWTISELVERKLLPRRRLIEAVRTGALPVTPEVAGSSPVAPVNPTRGSASGGNVAGASRIRLQCVPDRFVEGQHSTGLESFMRKRVKLCSIHGWLAPALDAEGTNSTCKTSGADEVAVIGCQACKVVQTLSNRGLVTNALHFLQRLAELVDRALSVTGSTRNLAQHFEHRSVVKGMAARCKTRQRLLETAPCSVKIPFAKENLAEGRERACAPADRLALLQVSPRLVDLALGYRHVGQVSEHVDCREIAVLR